MLNMLRDYEKNMTESLFSIIIPLCFYNTITLGMQNKTLQFTSVNSLQSGLRSVIVYSASVCDVKGTYCVFRTKAAMRLCDRYILNKHFQKHLTFTECAESESLFIVVHSDAL